MHAEHLQGLSLGLLIRQIGVKILGDILGLLALAVLVAMVVLRMHVPLSRRQRAAFNARCMMLSSLLHFDVSLAEATQHLLSINSRFCQLRLLHCVWPARDVKLLQLILTRLL